MLDLVITSALDNFIRNPFFEITPNKAKAGQHEESFRKLKNINIQAFCNDISLHLSGVDFTQFLPDACVDLYNSILSSKLDVHAPLKTRKRSHTTSKSPGLATKCQMWLDKEGRQNAYGWVAETINKSSEILPTQESFVQHYAPCRVWILHQ